MKISSKQLAALTRADLTAREYNSAGLILASVPDAKSAALKYRTLTISDYLTLVISRPPRLGRLKLAFLLIAGLQLFQN